MASTGTMPTWTVTVRLDAAAASLDDLVTALDALESASPAGSLAGDGVRLRLTVTVPTAAEALDKGLARLWAAVEPTPLATARPVSITVTEDTTESGLGLDELELAGVEEVAEILDLSPTSARELAASARFPDPICELAQGPVWSRGRIERYRERLDAMSG